MSRRHLPFLFIWDLDRTMIGNVEAVYCCEDDDMSSKHLYQKGLLRPGLAALFATIKRLFRHAEFFVFSAGDRLHVEKFLPIIEKHTKTIFRKPYFSRNQCMKPNSDVVVKDIRPFLRRIVNCLRKDYPLLTKPSQLRKRYLAIDDNPMWWPESNTVVECPPYDYIWMPGGTDKTKKIMCAVCATEDDVFARQKIIRHYTQPLAVIATINKQRVSSDHFCRDFATALQKYVKPT